MTTRRDFLKKTGVAAAALPIASPLAFAGGQDKLRVGLVGCGGRGSGAIRQALAADPGTVVVALADMFPDKVTGCYEGLKAQMPERLEMGDAECFTGLEGFREVISRVDVVLLATPPGFRPQHLRAAIEAGKHVFCEKPVAVDAPGVRSVLESARLAQEQGLSLASGFCWRAYQPKRAIYERIHSGAIGDLKMIFADYLAGDPWGRRRLGQEPTELHTQIRNWLYYTALSGDFIVEQAVHSIDKMMWAKQDEPPLRATALGGRQVRIEPEFGDVYDHFGVLYEWADGTQGLLQCRQINGCTMENLDRVHGSEGTAYIDGWADKLTIEGAHAWSWDGESNAMYQTEHDELFADIRAGGGKLNQGVAMAHSTMAAILGRMSAYTGQRLTWEQALASQQQLTPDAWDGTPLSVEVAMPGQTKFV